MTTQAKLLWTARALETLGGVLLAISQATNAMPPKLAAWAAIGSGIAIMVAGRIRQWLPSSSPTGKTTGAVLLAVGLGLAAAPQAGCVGAGWRAAHAVREAGTTTSKVLGNVGTAKRAECLKAHGSKTEAYQACTKRVREALGVWVSYVKPSLNAGLVGAVTGLSLAEKTKDKKFDWQAALKPAVCALTKMIRQFKDLFGSATDGVLAALGAVAGWSCSGGTP